jgi:formylglycine-generating enzyme required for sulfatase activity
MTAHPQLQLREVAVRQRSLLAILVLVILICTNSWSQEELRLALVIGNSDYEHFDSLRNPANDAADMGRVLGDLGFQVTTLIDAGFEQMDEAVYEFGRRLASEGGVGLFYYAGHGIEVGGTNYLIPVDARIRAEDEVRFRSVPVDQILAKMETARNGANIVILDACRDNPLRASARSAGSSRGLSVVQAPSGSLVVYATAPGAVAHDGHGRNGIFTGSLLTHIATPQTDVMEMLRAVRRDVMAATGNEQIPWENSSLISSFYFAERGASIELAPPSGAPDVSLQGNATADLYIESEPMGALVTIDGIEHGTTPLLVEDLPIGSAIVVEARQGTLTAREELSLRESELQSLSLVLGVETGNIVVFTSERGLEVKIDGERFGTLDSGLLRNVAAGEHILELSGDGLYYRGTVDVPADGTGRFEPSFEEVGTITHDLPPGAHVALTGPDGSTMALSGNGRLENMATGQYQVSITGLESPDEEVSFGLSRGTTERVAAQLGALHFTSIPPGAAVEVAGQYRGVTPLTIDGLSPGSVSYRLCTVGYLDAEGTVEVLGGRIVSQSEALIQTGSGSLETVLIQGATFLMGSRSGGDGSERPVHQVTLDSFWMTKTEITAEQYDEFARATEHDLPDDEDWGRGSRPVINVSWNDAVAYANWLSRQDGLEPAYDVKQRVLRDDEVTWRQRASGWRLPTEAEWEFAARYSPEATEAIYAGGDNPARVAWYFENSGGQTHPVGEKQPNPLGLYDMSGNVWEWCWDWSGEYSSQHETNPMGPASGSTRVIRGGSWYSSATFVRVAFRQQHPANGASRYIGFRLVRSRVQ